MTTPVITFFNSTRGVGATSFVYHLAWMYVELRLRVVVVDLDPQATLTATFLDEDQITEIFDDTTHDRTIFDAVAPLKRGIGDITQPQLYQIDYDEEIALVVGALELACFEDPLSEGWAKCLDKDERAFQMTTAFWRVMQNAAAEHQADVILVDLGPNLGAINRAALIATDYVVVPLISDLYSLQGMQHLGPTLQCWRNEWQERRTSTSLDMFPLPTGCMQPIGYILLQYPVLLNRPVRALAQWIARIPQVYRTQMLGEQEDPAIHINNDPHALTLFKNFGALKFLSLEARKPMFHLKPADEAMGSHLTAVNKTHKEFLQLAQAIQNRAGLVVKEYP